MAKGWQKYVILRKLALKRAFATIFANNAFYDGRVHRALI